MRLPIGISVLLLATDTEFVRGYVSDRASDSAIYPARWTKCLTHPDVCLLCSSYGQAVRNRHGGASSR